MFASMSQTKGLEKNTDSGIGHCPNTRMLNIPNCLSTSGWINVRVIEYYTAMKMDEL